MGICAKPILRTTVPTSTPRLSPANGFMSIAADRRACTDNGDGTTTIQLYENVQIDADTWHTATSAWYTVDAYGRGRDDVMETEVTFPGLSLAELAAYMGTPETLTYVQEAEGRNEWKITDGETIAACLKALEQMKVGEKTDLRAADAGRYVDFYNGGRKHMDAGF